MATAWSSFELLATDGEARRGALSLRHGVVQTPAFMPVGTYGTVKGITKDELRVLGAEIILANTFHLVCAPGSERVRDLGGLHRFMDWDGPILTDSGGFQVFSLRDRSRISEGGVKFRNPRGGEEILFTPEFAVQAQVNLGVDIAMAFDECPPLPSSRRRLQEAVDRTVRWAKQCRDVERDPATGPALFGITQGGLEEDLRAQCGARLAELDFDGYAIGGLSVGEDPNKTAAVVHSAAPRLPRGRPRYLMGVGYPEDIVEAVAAGVDMFDCVLPTRNARNGNLFTSRGRLIIKHAAWKDDPRPIDENCTCFTCQRYSRAYLRHLFVSDEMLGHRLHTIHNLHHYQDLMRRIRSSIEEGTFHRVLAWARSREGGLRPSQRRVERD